ncbi:hypothetical protein JV429_005540 [Escherichia coli]|nr:hypothetical protein [Escherichia coli]
MYIKNNKTNPCVSNAVIKSVDVIIANITTNEELIKNLSPVFVEKELRKEITQPNRNEYATTPNQAALPYPLPINPVLADILL